MTAELLITFLAVTIAYAAIPGPGTVYVAAQAVVRDPTAALWGALGLHVGGYVIVIASAAGLAALFAVVPVVYEALKLIGVVYLVGLGVRLVMSEPGACPIPRRSPRQPGPPRTFTQGVLVEVLNPTTAVFYVAMLPQFISVSASVPVWLQFVMLGLAVNVIFSLGDLLAILVAWKLRVKAGIGERGRRLVRWLGGGLLTGAGVRLALDRG
jgi:threonine/homoserine/homoserine lactone efflux protein